MMEHNELDTYLRTFSKRELEFLNHTITTNHYDSSDPIDLNGKKVIVFKPQNDLSLEKIQINKHTRFAEVPMHIHTWIEINYVYSGSCTQIINDQTIILSKGQICLIDTGTPHAILATGEDDIIINILIPRELLSTSFLSRLSHKGIISDFLLNAISQNQNHNHFIVFHSEQNKKIPRLMNDLLCEYFDKTPYFDEIIESYMIIIFTELLRVFKYDSHQQHTKNLNETSIINILQYIENNYQTCTLVSTAAYFNYNPSYFSTLIKKNTGKSFKELIRIQRLTYASLLIEKTSDPIYEIANTVGYENLNFFYKKFKEYFGLSPSEYRLKKQSSFNA
jgi:AraC family transcriptional regulator, melibiose operon regulatory protein